MAPHAAKAWKEILQLGKLDLETTLSGLGMPTKDIENEGRSINDLNWVTEDAFKIRLLRWRELIIKHDNIDIEALRTAAAISSALPEPTKVFGEGESSF